MKGKTLYEIIDHLTEEMDTDIDYCVKLDVDNGYRLAFENLKDFLSRHELNMNTMKYVPKKTYD